MTESRIRFVYKDSKGSVREHEIINISHDDTYIQGFSLTDRGLRTFRKDRVIEFTTGVKLAGCALVGEVNIGGRRKPSGKTEICFTGFNKADKNNLIDVVTTEGMLVRSSVTKDLNILCCGANAGPVKVANARLQNVIVLDEHQLMHLIETGEVPESKNPYNWAYNT